MESRGRELGTPTGESCGTSTFHALGGSEEQDFHLQPYDLAVSGDRLLVLCRGSLFGRICVLDSQTGALLYQIGPAREAGEADELRVPRSLAVHQDLCFVTDTLNHAIKIFNFRQRELVRTIGSAAATPPFDELDDMDPYYIMYHRGDARRSDLPCEFNEPVGVAFRDGRLYVSESIAGFKSCGLSMVSTGRWNVCRLFSRPTECRSPACA